MIIMVDTLEGKPVCTWNCGLEEVPEILAKIAEQYSNMDLVITIKEDTNGY